MKSPEYLVKDSKYFCILPWIHFHAWPDKKVLPCCVSDSSRPASEIKEGQSILEMMNSDEYKRMRVAMMNDEPYEPCRRCFKLEELGTWTMRNSQNQQKGVDNIELIEDTNEDGSIDEFNMKYMDIRFSNLCNFKCRSCGPQCSNLWAEEELKQFDNNVEEFKNAFRIDALLVDNTDDNDFMEQLTEHLGDVEEVYFAGGEILVQPQHYECLDYWVENDLCDQVHLNYTTNMSKLQHKVKGRGEVNLFDYWQKFPSIEVWASIDALGEHAEIIRKGTKWNRVIENLRSIKKNAPHVKLGITPTISLWNVWQYGELFDTLYQEGIIDLQIPPRMNILTSPDWASVKNLPQHMAWELVRKYEKQMEKYNKIDIYNEDGEPRELHHLENTWLILLTALKEGNGNVENLERFIAENTRLDSVRNEDIIKSIPELEELYLWTLQAKEN